MSQVQDFTCISEGCETAISEAGKKCGLCEFENPDYCIN